MLTKEFSVLECLKNIKHQLEMSKRRKEIKITFDIKGDLKHYNIKASKEPFEQIIYMILFRILKMCDFEDDVNLTVFNCAENFAEVPQFEKVCQRLHDQLSRNVQDYIYICIKSPCINGPRSSKLLTLINDCSDIVKRIDGMLVYEKQEIEEDYNIYIHQHPNLLHNPRIICLALPFKLGHNSFGIISSKFTKKQDFHYRDWAQDSMDELVIVPGIILCPLKSIKNN